MISERGLIFACGLGLLACAAIISAVVFGPHILARRAHHVIAGHTVKIETASGHGSGVHIGKGLVLTAAHVVEDATSFEIKTDAGEKLTGEKLWSSKDYDLALLRVGKSAGFGSTPLSCRDAFQNEPIYARGNPYMEEFLTVWGHADGKSTYPDLPVKGTARASMFFMPGMSGGPVLAANGDLLGIVSMGGSLPVGVYVTAPTICALLARSV
jgi:serine protease Do